MNTEEAKKIAEAIVLCVAAAYGKGRTVGELKQKCVEILTTEPAAPVEKEYHAGEWVPENGQEYFTIATNGLAKSVRWDEDNGDKYRLSQGNVYPTEAIAEAAKKHAEFWRAFDMADEGGEVEIYALDNLPGKIGTTFTEWRYGCPKFKSEDSARAWVDSHGGEAYVSEMLTKGRVFRFKWGA